MPARRAHDGVLLHITPHVPCGIIEESYEHLELLLRSMQLAAFHIGRYLEKRLRSTVHMTVAAEVLEAYNKA